MKKFIKKLFLFVVLVLLICSCVISVTFGIAAPQFSGVYTGSFVDKINRLNSINEPKIILVGNSNLAFGIDSKKIEQAFGMPVVNLGGHGGLGEEFHLNMAKCNINKGDIVICVPTQYENSGNLDPDLAWITIENHDLFHLIPKSDQFTMLKRLPRYAIKTISLWLKKEGNKDSGSAYSRSAVNKYGDVAFPRTENTYIFKEGSITVPCISDDFVSMLNEFNIYCKENGAVCLLASMPLAYGEFTPPAKEYIEIQKELSDELDFDVISNFTDYLIEYEYFCDTVYHLNDKGVQIRTDLLINDINRWNKDVDFIK